MPRVDNPVPASPDPAEMLRVAIETYAGVPMPEWEAVAATVEVINVKSGQTLIQDGTPHPHAYLILRGIVKLHDRLADGKVRTLAFREENEFVASISALRPPGIRRIYELGLDPDATDLAEAVQGVSRATATALEPSRLVKFDFSVIAELSTRHLAWAQMLLTYFYAHILHVQADAYQARSQTAEQRFRLLLARHPRWGARIKQRDLASYLGITEVGLSRIASRVFRESTAS